MNEQSLKVMLFLYVYSIFLSTATVGLVGSRLVGSRLLRQGLLTLPVLALGGLE